MTKQWFAPGNVRWAASILADKDLRAGRRSLPSVRRLLAALVLEKTTTALNRPFYDRGDIMPDAGPEEVWWFLGPDFLQDAELAAPIGALTLRLGHDPVYACPWDFDRQVAAFEEHGEGRERGAWKFDDLNHLVTWYEPLRLGFVQKGNHSITQGILAREGEVVCKAAYDISEVFRRYDTDGTHYYEKGTEEPVEEVRDVQWASVFYVASYLTAWLDSTTTERSSGGS